MRWLKVVFGVLGVLLLTGALAFVAWGLMPLGPTPVALDALESTDRVQVAETELGWEFKPTEPAGEQGLIFYPGGHVDARSYAPLARAIAATGRYVVITPMPLSLAVLNPDAADPVIDEHPEIKQWVIGGHSLGGAMAARYAAEHEGFCDGLLLLASYAPDGADLSETDMSATDVTGSLDSVLNADNHAVAQTLLPADTRAVVITGGNHAQYGNYGKQPGDTDASISTANQQRQTVVAADELFERVAGRAR